MRTERLHSTSTSMSGITRRESIFPLSSDKEGSAVTKVNNCSLVELFRAARRNFCRKKTLERKFPVLKWLPDYNPQKFISDMIAGLTVGLTILPQGLAYATLAGLPAQYGLYSSFAGCFSYVIFGSSNVVTIGPTAITSIITFTYTEGKSPEYAVLLCFLNGVIIFLMGFFKLGFIVNFISTPVNAGFISAAALTIISTQLKSLLGLSFEAEGFIPTVAGIITNFWSFRQGDAILSLCCIASLFILMKLQHLIKCVIRGNKILDRITWIISTSRNAIVVVGTTILAAYFQRGSFLTIGNIESGLPAVKPPLFNILDNSTNITHSSVTHFFKNEGSALIVVPLLSIMEHVTVAKAFVGDAILDPNQEMISIGMSNIVGSFFSSMPVTGSLSRTAVNSMSGAKTPMGGILTGSIVILSLQFLTPYFYYIPKAALASVIVSAVVFMIDYEVIPPMYRSKKMDFIPMILTFSVSLLIGLEFGMMCGFLLSVIFLLYYAARPGVKVKKGYTRNETEFILVELDRSLTFPSVDYIRYVIRKSSLAWGQNETPVVVDCVHIQFADFTAAQGIRDVANSFKKRNQIFILWRAKTSLVRILEGTRGQFIYCQSEDELERLLDERRTPELSISMPQLCQLGFSFFSI